MRAPPELLTLMDEVATAKINHEGTGIAKINHEGTGM
jgi:hypothetical protein